MAPPTSISNLISNNKTYGNLARAIMSAETAASPAANTTSGYISVHRCKYPFVVPAYSGVTEAFMTYCDMVYGGNTCTLLAALEYDLGNINMSTGTFTAGVSMPSKTIEGTNVTTASMMVIATASAAITATTPTIGITYTDQDGNTGQSASMVLPTNPVLNTGYWMNPHLASGDTGVRAITACTKSAGSAGTLRFYGLLPLAFAAQGTGSIAGTSQPLSTPFPKFPIAAADLISTWIFGSTSANDFLFCFSLEAGN